MPDGIVWYREHGEQEYNYYRGFIPVYEKIKIDYLIDTLCPLDKDMAKDILITAKRKLKKEIFKGILKMNKDYIQDNLIRLRQYKNVQ
ncbi:MAG TPA: hypothetical protein VK705_12745 [Ferruginibacter sp.]|jgi:hypothetical protein|nr:hypothetical protein [Ferruginibacter sp.]